MDLELEPHPIADAGPAEGFVRLVAGDVEAAHAELAGRRVEVGAVQDVPRGGFVCCSDLDGNGWAVRRIPPRR